MFDLNNYLSFAVHGAQDQHGGGVAGSVDAFLAFLESLTEKSAGEIFATIMPGISAMENFHPLFVHFPIAFLMAFVLIDVGGSLFGKLHWRQAAGWFLYLGTVMAAATVAAGLDAAESVAHGDNVHAVMEQHEHLGIAVLVLSVVLSLWRLFSKKVIQGGANALYLILAVLLVFLLIFTADLGGYMVYNYGVSVKTQSPTMLDFFQQHSH